MYKRQIDERAKINTSRSVAAMIAIGVLNIITVPLLSKFGSHSAKTGYLTVAVIYGSVSYTHLDVYKRQQQMELLEDRYVTNLPGKVTFGVSSQHYTFTENAFVELVKRFGSVFCDKRSVCRALIQLCTVRRVSDGIIW